MNTVARNGYFIITFTDDTSKHKFVYLMKRKFEAFEMFKEFKTEVELQIEKKKKKKKILRSILEG